jgi:hypothetical protein
MDLGYYLYSLRTVSDLITNNVVNINYTMKFVPQSGNYTANLTVPVTTDQSSAVTAARNIPVIGLQCQINGTRNYRYFQVAIAPNSTGYDATQSDPYIATPPATVDQAVFNQTTATFNVGIKSVQPPINSSFKVGDQIGISVVITSTAKSIS